MSNEMERTTSRNGIDEDVPQLKDNVEDRTRNERNDIDASESITDVEIMTVLPQIIVMPLLVQ